MVTFAIKHLSEMLPWASPRGLRVKSHWYFYFRGRGEVNTAFPLSNGILPPVGGE